MERSLDWLKDRYLTYLEKMVKAGNLSGDTLKQRRSMLKRVCDFSDPEGTRYGECDLDAPPSAFVAIRDDWADRPGAADNMIKSIRAMYQWAIEHGTTSTNPCAGIGKINLNSKGATPWTADDLKKFKECHPKGGTAHLWLTLQAFTTCRIGDAVWLGRDQEKIYNGQIYLEYQPRKKGSAPVSIPMLPPLYEATRAGKVVGPSYILNSSGRPYKSTEGLRVRVQRWLKEAGITERSSHGIRKAMGELLAEEGCSQHQIMAIMSHTQAKTSEVYTKGAERRILATGGMQALATLDW
ncbi:tyrosine-type recombinase/integrase [Leisingera sp. M523]|uniref:tyrosine-type recombinase/integrase n=1 Tax=Leisingera sp. M523 TaxID=2867013 RepID=UPI0021A453F2|nr:tyrosine-type recombinase/integrase [Leisingera sp. M523]